ncbi:MAG: TonB-dependent receptor, partial [Acidobacteriia bacterium]|nr:TonB-dependent receptor [Terriglobia bacterium]
MSLRDDRAAWGAALLLVALVPATVFGQLRGVVVDQTGLPLPGAHVDVRRANQLIINLDTGLDGGFELPDLQPNDVVAVSLDGFETVYVAPADAHRIVLPLAHATETTEVVASALTTAGAAMEHLGSTMTAPLAQRLPTARPRILQSLPLLPGVVRGRDGQLNIGGTRPHESTLWIDGFDITDPVRGITSIDLPVESVRGMAVLREPVSATFSDVLGSAASIETTPGGDQWKAGVQGFIPRPRLSQLGFGRIEAFFPRAYFGGRRGIARIFASTEFNFERVPVPGVTGSSGQPNIGTTGITSFARFDLQPSTRHSITLEGLFAPATTTDAALSTLRPAATSPDVSLRDLFGGVTDRLVVTPRDLLTIRAGVNTHRTTVTEAGSSDPVLTPDGWQQNWFSSVDVSGARQTVSVSWDHAGLVAHGAHNVSVNTDLHRRSMSGSLTDRDIHITDTDGRLARLIRFGPAGSLGVTEVHGGVGLRDLWDVTRRLQVDLGIRFDGGASSDAIVPGPRIGARYLLDDAGRTTVRGSAGRYVGRVPLSAAAFGQFPSRTTTTFDMNTGQPMRTVEYRPSVSPLPLPRADAVALEIEHRFTPSLEAQAAVRERHGSPQDVARGQPGVRQLRAVVVGGRLQRLRIDVHESRCAAVRAGRASPDGGRRAASPARVGDVLAAAQRRRVTGRRVAQRLSVHGAQRVPTHHGHAQQRAIPLVFFDRRHGVQDVRGPRPEDGPRAAALQPHESRQPARRDLGGGLAAVSGIREQLRHHPR